eukprot:2212861-Rhodomonas_salina.1
MHAKPPPRARHPLRPASSPAHARYPLRPASSPAHARHPLRPASSPAHALPVARAGSCLASPAQPAFHQRPAIERRSPWAAQKNPLPSPEHIWPREARLPSLALAPPSLWSDLPSLRLHHSRPVSYTHLTLPTICSV